MTNDTPNVLPFEFALEFLKALEVKQEIELPEWANTSFSHLLIDLHPGITAVRPTDAASQYYQIAPDLAQHLSVMAWGNPDIAQIILTICSANIWNGQPIPFPFRGACMKLLRGEQVWPKTRGRKAGVRFGAFWLAVSTVKMLVDAYGLSVARGDDKEGVSASDITAEALTEMGVPCTYVNVRDWCQNKKNVASRTKVELLRRMLNEHVLKETGLVKDWSFPIHGLPLQYAPIHVLGRMTGR